MAFTSYPGVLSSNDDFYITEQQLYVSETTNSIFNMDVYDNMSPNSVFVWMRVLISNRLATCPEEWIGIFKRYNSGTYNNQYKILDFKRIDLEKKTLAEKTFMIIEQLPGMYRVQDQTTILKRGYWPSFNSPFDPDIQKESGYPENFEQKPDLIPKMHYFMGSRPSIMRRDQNTIQSNEDMMNFITRNDYKNDPYTRNNPSLAVAARYDLVEDTPKCHGLISAEMVTAKELIGKKQKKFHLITGPTHNGVDPYTWETSRCKNNPGTRHDGQVEKFEFEWFEHETILFDY